jgi:hypothetical protein
MTGTNRRELDYRQTEGGGLGVGPLRNRRPHNLTVEVDDRGPEVRDPSVARNAFMHPFAHMRRWARR